MKHGLNTDARVLFRLSSVFHPWLTFLAGALDELSLLRLDRFMGTEYLDFHGVCFPFQFEFNGPNLGLGTPTHLGAQSPFPESRYLNRLHRQP